MEGELNQEQAAVAAFHRKFGHPVAERPRRLSIARASLRRSLIEEEAQEAQAAMIDIAVDHHQRAAISVASVAEELADLIIVAYGAACEMGVDLGPVIAAKMASNMTKSQDKRADGKTLKGSDYVPADIEAVIRAQPEGAMD